MHSTGPQQSTLLIVVGISTVLPASSTIVLVAGWLLTVSVIVSVTVEVLMTVIVCVVVLVVVFVTVFVCASLHPARDKISEAEITTVKRMTPVFFNFKVYKPPLFDYQSLFIFHELEIFKWILRCVLNWAIT
jgi:ABC-type cobalt transport system substrate-binding protein